MMGSSYNSKLCVGRAVWPYEPEHVRTRLCFWQGTLTHRALIQQTCHTLNLITYSCSQSLIIILDWIVTDLQGALFYLIYLSMLYGQLFEQQFCENFWICDILFYVLNFGMTMSSTCLSPQNTKTRA